MAETKTLNDRILEDVKTLLKDDITSDDENKLNLFVKLSICNVKKYRNYPSEYTESMILDDLENYYSTIIYAVLNAWNRQGTEGEKSHSENNVSVSFINESELYANVIPIARFI